MWTWLAVVYALGVVASAFVAGLTGSGAYRASCLLWPMRLALFAALDVPVIMGALARVRLEASIAASSPKQPPASMPNADSDASVSPTAPTG